MHLVDRLLLFLNQNTTLNPNSLVSYDECGMRSDGSCQIQPIVLRVTPDVVWANNLSRGSSPTVMEGFAASAEWVH